MSKKLLTLHNCDGKINKLTLLMQKSGITTAY